MKGRISIGARAARSYVAGMSALGLMVGYMAGASQSPVVGVALPLLFGLLGGAGGLYIAKADLSQRRLAMRLLWIGRGTLAFSAAVFLGIVAGMSVRTGRGIGVALPTISDERTEQRAAKLPDDVGPREAVGLAVLRHRLESLGATTEEVESVLVRTSRELNQSHQKPESLENLGRAAAVAWREVEQVFAHGVEAAPEASRPALVAIQTRLRVAAADIEPLTQAAGRDTGFYVDNVALKAYVDRLALDLPDPRALDDGVRVWLDESPTMRQAYDRAEAFLTAIIAAITRKLRPPGEEASETWLESDGVSKLVNEYLRVAAAKAEARTPERLYGRGLASDTTVRASSDPFEK